MGFGGAVVACMGGSGDMLEMSVVRGVGGVCDVCMCLTRGGVGGEVGEWMRGLGSGFTNPVGTGGVLDMCLCFWLRWCMWGVGRGLGPGSGGVVLCLCEV